jgi:hypothetical protein
MDMYPVEPKPMDMMRLIPMIRTKVSGSGAEISEGLVADKVPVKGLP